MARQPAPLGSRPIRSTIVGIRCFDRSVGRRPTRAGAAAGDRWSAAPPGRSAARRNHPIRIGHDRVAELDLDPDDRPQAGLLDGRRPADDSVEALMIGDREAGQPELGRPFSELVGCRRAVEEREVRVAVELGIGSHRGPHE